MAISNRAGFVVYYADYSPVTYRKIRLTALPPECVDKGLMTVKPTVFEADDGWLICTGITNLLGRTRGWCGQIPYVDIPYVDAVSPAHARIEDAIRTGKGLRRRQVTLG